MKFTEEIIKCASLYCTSLGVCGGAQIDPIRSDPFPASARSSRRALWDPRSRWTTSYSGAQSVRSFLNAKSKIQRPVGARVRIKVRGQGSGLGARGSGFQGPALVGVGTRGRDSGGRGRGLGGQSQGQAQGQGQDQGKGQGSAVKARVRDSITTRARVRLKVLYCSISTPSNSPIIHFFDQFYGNSRATDLDSNFYAWKYRIVLKLVPMPTHQPSSTNHFSFSVIPPDNI